MYLLFCSAAQRSNKKKKKPFAIANTTVCYGVIGLHAHNFLYIIFHCKQNTASVSVTIGLRALLHIFQWKELKSC